MVTNTQNNPINATYQKLAPQAKTNISGLLNEINDQLRALGAQSSTSELGLKSLYNLVNSDPNDNKLVRIPLNYYSNKALYLIKQYNKAPSKNLNLLNKQLDELSKDVLAVAYVLRTGKMTPRQVAARFTGNPNKTVKVADFISMSNSSTGGGGNTTTNTTATKTATVQIHVGNNGTVDINVPIQQTKSSKGRDGYHKTNQQTAPLTGVRTPWLNAASTTSTPGIGITGSGKEYTIQGKNTYTIQFASAPKNSAAVKAALLKDLQSSNFRDQLRLAAFGSNSGNMVLQVGNHLHNFTVTSGGFGTNLTNMPGAPI